MSSRVLIVDDDQSTCELLDAGLRRRGFDTLSRTSATEGLVHSGTNTAAYRARARARNRNRRM